MEVAIPILTLGAMYIISNEEPKKRGEINQKKHCKEGFSNNIYNPRQYNNLNIQPVNKYFDKNANKEQLNFNQNKNVDLDDFKHNNMVPFFGGNLKGPSIDKLLNNDTILDSKQGSGSVNITKKETAPLFNPMSNATWVDGTPNSSDFIQSRMNSSNRMANVKPWDEKQVGPGLGIDANKAASDMGYNSGMSNFLPKNVDELRVLTNPKQSHALDNLEGPALSHVKKLGLEGKVEKYNPNTFYENNPNRWFVTTNSMKAATTQSKNMIKEQNRVYTTKEYGGTVSGSNSTYTPKIFEESKRSDVTLLPELNNYAPEKQVQNNKNSFVKNSKYNDNCRSQVNNSIMGGPGSVVSAMFSPILDLIRPTKKENFVGNARLYENPESVVKELPMFNYNDRTKTTIKEMTEESKQNYVLQGQGYSMYGGSNYQPSHTQRATASSSQINGGMSQQGSLFQSYDAASNQINNINKEQMVKTRTSQGGTQVFNSNQHIDIRKNENDIINNRSSLSTLTYGEPPTKTTHGLLNAPVYKATVDSESRMDKNLLNAFKQNPYTHSLQTCV